MKLIVGLGNPGFKYAQTKHNVGFIVLDQALKLNKMSFSEFKLKKKFNALISEGTLDEEKTMLVKPQTYMNKSGESINALINFYKLNPKKDILIIYDDIDLPIGEIRTTGKSAAGHKGMQSIIDIMGTNEIQRIRIGIRPPAERPKIPTDKFVLQNFTKEEKRTVSKVIEQVIDKIKSQFS